MIVLEFTATDIKSYNKAFEIIRKFGRLQQCGESDADWKKFKASRKSKKP